MNGLLMRAIIGAASVAALQAVSVFAFGWSLPLWTWIAVPGAAGIAVFLIAGRRRALRRQRSRRRVSPLRSGGPRVPDMRDLVVRNGNPRRRVHALHEEAHEAPPSAQDFELATVVDDDGPHLR